MGCTTTFVKNTLAFLLRRTQKVLRYHSNLVLVSPPLKPFCILQISSWKKTLVFLPFSSYLEKKLDRTCSVSYSYAETTGILPRGINYTVILKSRNVRSSYLSS